jgi:hypothetical protein
MNAIRLVLLICVVFSMLTNDRATADYAAPIELQLSKDFVNPIGLYDVMPTFSWQFPQDVSVQRQAAYRIVVGSAPLLLSGEADLWDSSEVVSDQSTYVPYADKALKSLQPVCWQNQFLDEHNRASDWSALVRIELDLRRNRYWKGQWMKMIGTRAELTPKVWQEKDTILESAPDIKIIQAFYGDWGAKDARDDVTDIIREMITAGLYVVHATDVLTGGQGVGSENKLEIDVVNLWPSRLIGDERFADDCDKGRKAWPSWMDEYLKTRQRSSVQRLTFTTWDHYLKGGDSLIPSGLLGPVTI